MKEPLLTVEGLTVELENAGRPIRPVTDLHFRIHAGETVCLIGESGSGKSIASKALMRLTDFEGGRIASGSVKLGGQELTTLPMSKMTDIRGNKIAMIFQEPMTAFDPVYTLGAQLTESILRHTKRTRKEARKHATELLRRVGLSEPELRMSQYPGELSGGMLQRAMIAMALACGPELLIADEPTTALDMTIQSQILNLLNELKTEFGMSILLITHDLGVAAEMADRILVMYAGKIVERAPADRLFANPRHPYTRGLMRSVPKLDSDRRNPLYTIEGSPPSSGAFPSGCRFHPRCPLATDRCRDEAPPLSGDDTHQAACWHSDSLLHQDALRIREVMDFAQAAAVSLPDASRSRQRADQALSGQRSVRTNEGDHSRGGRRDTLGPRRGNLRARRRVGKREVHVGPRSDSTGTGDFRPSLLPRRRADGRERSYPARYETRDADDLPGFLRIV